MHRNIRVATWNIGSLYADYENNLDYLERIIKSSKADILCMQEVPNKPALLQSICHWGNFGFQAYHTTSISHVCPDNDMGIAVFSRFPLGQPEIIKLTKPTVEIFYDGHQEYWHDKYFMAVRCMPDGRPFTVVTGHGFPFHRYGLENPDHFHIVQPSFRELDGWFAGLAEKQGLPVLCAAADFNITDPMQFMPKSAAQYRDVFYGEATRPSGRKTDAILVCVDTAESEKTNIRPPLKDNGKSIFDHNFVMVQLPYEA